MVFFLGLSLSSMITSAFAADRYYHLVLESMINNAKSPDCQDLTSNFKYLFLVRDALNPILSNDEESSENAAVVGGNMVGPLIEADEGDILHIQVTNNHPFMGTSIHWHGIHQMGTPYMDGTAGMTQCQLQPLATQNFTFEAYPAGTFFWHGHFGMAEGDGVSGPLIVHPKKPPTYEYDEDVVVFLQDFYSVTGEQQQVGLMSFPFVWMGNPDSILIGGKGIANKCEIPVNNSEASVPGCMDGCASDPLSQLMTIKVETGKVYLLRFICSTSLVILNIAIGGHNLTIVGEDNNPIEPIDNVSSFNIGPGQRYVALLNATQPSGSYWLEASVAERDIPNLVGRAIIQYDTEEAAVLPTEEPYHPPWNNGDLCPLCDLTPNPQDFPEYVGLTTPESEITRYTLVVSQVHDIGEDMKQTGLGWGVNNVSFAFTTPEPLIGMAVRAAKENGWPTKIPGTIDLPQDPPSSWNYTVSVGSSSVANAGAVGVSVIRANKGQVIDIVLQNSNQPSDTHQWHMHGHSYWVIGQGEGVFNPDVDVPKFNLKNPGLRDTVTNWPNGWTAIRVTMNNPGVWFFHCHILPHLQMGMAVGLVVQADQIADFPDETASVQYCTASDSLDMVSVGSSLKASAPLLFSVSAVMAMLAMVCSCSY